MTHMDEMKLFNSKLDIPNIICADRPLCSVSVWWSYFLSILFNYISTYSYVNVGLLSQIQSVPRNYLAMLLNRLITIFPYIVTMEVILFWLWPYVLWPLISVHKWAETIYMRKYGMWLLSRTAIPSLSWKKGFPCEEIFTGKNLFLLKGSLQWEQVSL